MSFIYLLQEKILVDFLCHWDITLGYPPEHLPGNPAYSPAILRFLF